MDILTLALPDYTKFTRRYSCFSMNLFTWIFLSPKIYTVHL